MVRTIVDSDPPSSKFLRTREAAEFLALSPRTLENLRSRGQGGPPWRRHGRIIVYELSELLAWSEAQRVPGSTGSSAG